MNLGYVPVADLTSREAMIARQKEIRRRQEEAARRLPAQPQEQRAVLAPVPVVEASKVKMIDPLAHLPRSIIRRVAAEYGTTYADIVGSETFAHIICARHAAILAVHKAHPSYSLPKLGRIFSKDHSSIRNALRGPRSAQGRMKQTTGSLSKNAALPKEIIVDIAKKYKISTREITGRDYRPVVLKARVEAIITISAAHPNMTQRQIAQIFDDRAPSAIGQVLKRHTTARIDGVAA